MPNFVIEMLVQIYNLFRYVRLRHLLKNVRFAFLNGFFAKKCGKNEVLNVKKMQE